MIYLGADHAGFELKEFLKKYLDKKKIKYNDLGALKKIKEDDYPKYAFKVAKQVAKEKNAKGILICGTGVGMCMAANRIKGVRAALVHDNKYAKATRLHNDSNVLCLSGWEKDFKKQSKLVDIWLKTNFENIPRRKRRVKQLK